MSRTPKFIFLAKFCEGNQGQTLVGLLVAIPIAAITLAAMQKSMVANLKGARDIEARENIDSIKLALNQVLAHPETCSKTFTGLDLTLALNKDLKDKNPSEGAPVSIRMGRDTLAAPGLSINNGTIKVFHFTEKDANARKSCNGTTTYAMNLHFSGSKRQYLGSSAFSSMYTVYLNAGSDNKVIGCGTENDVCATAPPIPAPTCTLTANPSSITLGQSITFTLLTSGLVTNSKIDSTNVPNPNGTLVETPPSAGPGTATGTVFGPGGSGSCTASYTVIPPAPTCTISANPSSITLGQPITFTLLTTGVVTSSKINSTSVANPTGNLIYYPPSIGPATATGTVSGPGGSASCFASYTVASPYQYSCDLYVHFYGTFGCGPSHEEYFSLRAFDSNASRAASLAAAPNGPDCVGSNCLEFGGGYGHQLQGGCLAGSGDQSNVFKSMGAPKAPSPVFWAAFPTGSHLFSLSSCTYHSDSLSPLVVNFSQKGLEFVNSAYGPLFDLLGNGIPLLTAWPNNPPQNVFLVNVEAEATENKTIRSLFGNSTLGPDGKMSDNGFEALKKYDINHDGVIDKNDPLFAKLRLWSDLDFTGTAPDRELKTLDALGLTQIDLHYTSVTEFTDASGNESRQKSSVRLKDGSTRNIYDIWLTQMPPEIGKMMRRK